MKKQSESSSERKKSDEENFKERLNAFQDYKQIEKFTNYPVVRPYDWTSAYSPSGNMITCANNSTNYVAPTSYALSMLSKSDMGQVL